jgi:hypothetical protein
MRNSPSKAVICQLIRCARRAIWFQREEVTAGNAQTQVLKAVIYMIEPICQIGSRGIAVMFDYVPVTSANGVLTNHQATTAQWE